MVLRAGGRDAHAFAGYMPAVLRPLAAPPPAARVDDAGGARQPAGAARPVVGQSLVAVLARRGAAAARAQFLRCVPPYLRAVLRGGGPTGTGARPRSFL